MSAFTPVSASIGGALIGVAIVLLMLLIGRLAGISGILGGLLSGERDRSWRVAFIIGLILAPVVAGISGYSVPVLTMPTSWGTVTASGLLVGFGSRLASGCTSGHGVCGIARLSTRSIVATGVFMSTAIAVVAPARHVL